MGYPDQTLSTGGRALSATAVAGLHAGMAFALVAGMPGVAMKPISERAVTGITFPPSPSRAEGGDLPSSKGVPDHILKQAATQSQRPHDEPRITGSGPYVHVVPEPIAPICVCWPPYDGPFPPSSLPKPINPETWIDPNEIPFHERYLKEDWIRYSLTVGTDGRAHRCEIVRRSFDPRLDEALCESMMLRARFEPARDLSGAPIEGIYENSIRWELAD